MLSLQSTKIVGTYVDTYNQVNIIINLTFNILCCPKLTLYFLLHFHTFFLFHKYYFLIAIYIKVGAFNIWVILYTFSIIEILKSMTRQYFGVIPALQHNSAFIHWNTIYCMPETRRYEVNWRLFQYSVSVPLYPVGTTHSTT